MESDLTLPSRLELAKCSCNCNCSLIGNSYSYDWLRSVKRKLDEFEEGNTFSVPGFDVSSIAHVKMENECTALREMVSQQQQTIHDLYVELDEERNASASAANEAMSMMLRLQREKAEVQMEFRQFKSFAEEKIHHDQDEILAIEDLLYKREQSIQSLIFEAQAYKHRMLSFGVTESEAEGTGRSMQDFPYDYPPLKCNMNEVVVDSEIDIEQPDVEKHTIDSIPNESCRNISNVEEHSSLKRFDHPSETADESSDRVYTIDSIQKDISAPESKEVAGYYEDYTNTPPNDSSNPYVEKLYMRIQALEADRESMRQSIISMRTEKAQLVLLREIAQHLRKESPDERRIVINNINSNGKFSAMEVLKLVLSFIFSRRRGSKYRSGTLGSDTGLRMLLDNGGRVAAEIRRRTHV